MDSALAEPIRLSSAPATLKNFFNFFLQKDTNQVNTYGRTTRSASACQAPGLKAHVQNQGMRQASPIAVSLPIELCRSEPRTWIRTAHSAGVRYDCVGTSTAKCLAGICPCWTKDYKMSEQRPGSRIQLVFFTPESLSKKRSLAL